MTLSKETLGNIAIFLERLADMGGLKGPKEVYAWTETHAAVMSLIPAAASAVPAIPPVAP